MKTLTVSELNNYIANLYMHDFLLSNVSVKGELCDYKLSRGNYYFSIKDENGSSIDCILFSNIASELMENFCVGQNVIISGRISFYQKLGKTTLIVNNIEKEGLGKYYIELQKLKEKLSKEGLFEDSHKRKLPKYISVVGIVTSKTGAVIEDIKRTIWENNPYTRLILYSAKVQGEGAADTIIDGIDFLNGTDAQVIIVARGGGSKEDLSCFNDEKLAYKIFNSNLPIVAAIGHEIDYSIADMVADKTVATPTAAGEMVSFNYNETIERLDAINDGMLNILNMKIDDYNEKIITYTNNLSILSPKSKIEKYKEILNYKNDILNSILNQKIFSIKNKFHMYINTLKSLDAVGKLKTGYAYVTNEKNIKINSSHLLKKGNIINLRFNDGTAKAKVI